MQRLTVMRAASRNRKPAIEAEERKWVADVLDHCESEKCLANAYIERTNALSDRLIPHGRVREQGARDACVALAQLADDGKVASLALHGRRQWVFPNDEARPSKWRVTATEKRVLEDWPETMKPVPEGVYRLQLSNKGDSTIGAEMVVLVRR